MKDIGKILRDYRNNAGLSVKAVSDTLIKKGYRASTKTVYSWESGNSRPSPDALLVLCDMYGITDVLGTFGYDGYNDDGSLQLSLVETEIIEKYRDLDDHGKEMVDTVIQKETERMKRAKLEALAQIETEDLNHYWTPVSAGEGAVVDTLTDFDVIHVVSNIYTRKAAFVLTVRGESMAPRFHDGDLVLVQEADDTEIGEVGVWFMDGYSYIKQKGHDKLISLNNAYRDVYPDEFIDCRCQGLVLGVLDPEWIVEK